MSARHITSIIIEAVDRATRPVRRIRDTISQLGAKSRAIGSNIVASFSPLRERFAGVREQSAEGGRRLVSHQYPGRDTPWTEDLGRALRQLTLEMHITGSNYISGRDALLAALEQSGAGELVHPWFGRMQVHCQQYTLRENTQAGGQAMMRWACAPSWIMILAGTKPFPTSPSMVSPASACR